MPVFIVSLSFFLLSLSGASYATYLFCIGKYESFSEYLLTMAFCVAVMAITAWELLS